MIQSSPETCTSPAADWEKTLSLYTEQRLTKIYTNTKEIKAKQRILSRAWYLFGWAGLQHRDPHEIANALYDHLSEHRRKEPVQRVVCIVDDFRRWLTSR